MRERFQTRLAVLAFFILIAAPAWSQQLGSIVGMVRVTRGDFPEPVLVNLQIRGATMASAYTDSNGRFSFNTLYANVYHIIINDDRYQPVDVSAQLRPEIQSTLIMQINLMPRSGSSKPTGGPSVVSAGDFANYPKKAVKEFEHGLKKETEGKNDEAIGDYRRAIKDAPNFAIAHNNLGALYVGKSEFSAAQSELTESIRLAPSDSKAYFNMANLMLLTGKLADAQRYLQDGFRKQPDSAFGFFVEGSVQERTGNYADAERALRRALELDPKMPRPHLELVNLYLREHRSPDAISELQAFLQVAPTDPLAPKAREVLGKLKVSTAAPQR